MNFQKQNEEPLSSDWSKSPKIASEQKVLAGFNRTSRWIFWTFLIVALSAIAVSGFYFYQYYNSSGVEINMEGPSEILAGVPFEIKIKVQNNSDKAINDAAVSMVLPENSAFTAADPQNTNVLNHAIGSMDKGEIYQDSFSVIVFGTQQITQKFEATASYYPPALGAKAKFEKTTNINVSVREPAVKIDLSVPQKILNNENFSVTASYQNISEIDFPKMRLRIDYPSSFTFQKSTPPPTSGNNVWETDNLPKNSDNKSITIQGKVLAPENSFFDIKTSAFVEFNGKEYLVNEKSASLNIAQSPLSLAISLNGQNNYVAFPNDSLRYNAVYKNNSDTGLNDVVITLRLSGEMFDAQTLSTNGFFNSLTNTITWNAANTPDLRVIQAGGTGQVSFNIMTKSSYPIKRVSDKNFILKISGEISSPTVPYYVASDKTIGLTNFETKVGGQAAINSQAFFGDPSSGIFNAGSLPPKVNKATDFTIHWTITNYATDLQNVTVKAFLQSGVKWTNAVKSNISSLPTYNERTQEVNWQIDQIPATKGIISNPIEAVFQVEATPDVTQMGQVMPLLSQTLLTATDQFINAGLTSSAQPVATQSVITQ